MTALPGLFATSYRQSFERLRAVLVGLEAAQVNRSPHPEANSIAVLVVHTVGSARFVLRGIRDLENPRDRDSEFAAELDVTALDELLNAVDQEVAEHAAAITDEMLTRPRRLPDGREQTGLIWLIANTGHAREHVGQAELTRQLLQARSEA